VGSCIERRAQHRKQSLAPARQGHQELKEGLCLWTTGAARYAAAWLARLLAKEECYEHSRSVKAARQHLRDFRARRPCQPCLKREAVALGAMKSLGARCTFEAPRRRSPSIWQRQAPAPESSRVDRTRRPTRPAHS